MSDDGYNQISKGIIYNYCCVLQEHFHPCQSTFKYICWLKIKHFQFICWQFYFLVDSQFKNLTFKLETNKFKAETCREGATEDK